MTPPPFQLRARTVTNVDGTFVVLENDGIGGDLLAGKRWEPHFRTVIEALDLTSTTAIDVGANIGCNTVHLARAVGTTGIVLAFEPQRIAHQQLCGTVVLSGYPNVVTFQQALGDHEAIVELEPVNYFVDNVNVGNTGLGQGGERVTMSTLDSFGATNVSFIKLDVQGSELSVLRGAAKTVERERPVLFLEIEEDQLSDRGSSPRALVSHLFEINYTLLHLRNEYPVDFVAAPVEREAVLSAIASKLDFPTAICRP